MLSKNAFGKAPWVQVRVRAKERLPGVSLTNAPVLGAVFTHDCAVGSFMPTGLRDLKCLDDQPLLLLFLGPRLAVRCIDPRDVPATSSPRPGSRKHRGHVPHVGAVWLVVFYVSIVGLVDGLVDVADKLLLPPAHPALGGDYLDPFGSPCLSVGDPVAGLRSVPFTGDAGDLLLKRTDILQRLVLKLNKLGRIKRLQLARNQVFVVFLALAHKPGEVLAQKALANIDRGRWVVVIDCHCRGPQASVLM